MTLLPQHAKQLDESAIAPSIRMERGYKSIERLEEWSRLGGDMPDYQRRLPGLAYPVYRLAQLKPYTMVLRPDKPRVEPRDDGKERIVKYEWPAGRPLCIDILPRYQGWLRDTSVPIWFTEGAKKSDALASLGQRIVPAALNGVWCWKHRTADGDSVPLPDFDELALKGRTVVLAFDSDLAVNAHVRKALDAFTAFLVGRGARVGILHLPHNDKKLGVDDAIADGWSFADLERAIHWHANRSRLLPVDQLAMLPATTWLIDGLLARNKLSQTFAPPGSGKSFLELDKALCIAQRHPVIYVAAEAVEDYHERVAAWCAHHKRGPGQISFWPEPIMLKDPANVEAFLKEIATVQPAAIFIDPLASCMVGLEESSTGDMTIAVEALNRIRRETGAAVHVVHHTGWSDGHERGSSVLRAACRVVMKLSLDDSGLMTLTCEKSNNGKPFEARYFRLATVGSSAVPIPANKLIQRNAPLSARQVAILESLELAHFRTGASFTQIVEHTGMPKSTANKAISVLLDRGLIAADGAKHKVYTLTDSGKDELQVQLAHTTTDSAVPVHQGGELTVNWLVNGHGTARNGKDDSEFTPEEQSEPEVHQVREPSSSPESTQPKAAESASSLEFTGSSPVVHLSEFTSSPGAHSLECAESEQANHDPPNTSTERAIEGQKLAAAGQSAATVPAPVAPDKIPFPVGQALRKPDINTLIRQRQAAEDAKAAARAYKQDDRG